MSRAVKLFCIIGPLFITIAIISFIWPSIVIKNDIDKVETIFTRETQKEQISSAENRAAIFKIKLTDASSLIKSSLLYVKESKTLQESFEKAVHNGDAWKRAGDTLSYNTGIGLLQVTKNGAPVLAIAPQNAILYASKITKLNEHVIYILVDDYRGILEPFIGIQLKNEDVNLSDPLDFYFLYPVSYIFPTLSTKSPELLKNLRLFANDMNQAIKAKNINTLKDLIGYFSTRYDRKTVEMNNDNFGPEPSPKELLAFYEEENPFFTKVRIREFIRTLLDGIDESPFENGAPYGIASLPLNRGTAFNGIALMASDLFFNQILTTNTSSDKQSFIIDSPLLNQIFIGADVLVKTADGTFDVTLGSSISPILSDLISNQEAIAIIAEDGKPYVAINPSGLSLPHATITQISLQAIKIAPYGILDFNGITYQFMQLKPFPNNNLTIVLLRPASADPLATLHKVIIDQLNSTTKSLAEQLLAINVAILLVALIVLLLLSRAVTKTVRELAKVTEELAKGNYAEITLPEITKDPKDEISILREGFETMIIALRDKEKMRAVLNKVVSKEIAAEILKGNIHLGGENRIMTVMFADIRNFTGLSEKIDPQRLITFLNKFMTKMSVIIEEHYGVIDKYVGDEIMALYGAPHLDPDGARKAVETALAMREDLKKWNVERVAEGFPEISIGIGINTGKMVAGNMGAENRLNYTVLGANVNLGARLCGKAAPMQILVSEQTLESCGLKERLQYEEIEALTLKGLSEPVKAFSIIGYKP